MTSLRDSVYRGIRLPILTYEGSQQDWENSATCCPKSMLLEKCFLIKHQIRPNANNKPVEDVPSRLATSSGLVSNKKTAVNVLPNTSPRKISDTTALQNRPLDIALMDIGGVLGIKLDEVTKKLNSLQQDLFHFEVMTPALTDLGDYDKLHFYSDKVLFDHIKGRIRGSSFKYGIGITHETLDEGRFNRHAEKDGMGVVTIDDAKQYTPPGKSLLQYLCFLILCEAFCITGGEHFEHDERKYCLFDMCAKKHDLVACLAKPHICPHCETRLKQAGFLDRDIVLAKKVLAYVGRPSLLYISKEIINNPIAGFILGGLIVNLLAAFIHDFPFKWSLVILFWLLLGYIAIMIVRYKQAQPRA